MLHFSLIAFHKKGAGKCLLKCYRRKDIVNVWDLVSCSQLSSDR
jgi:hypothetical protein